MKERVFKCCMCLMALAAAMAGISLFFNRYPDVRFFWNICVLLVTGFQVFWMVIGKKRGRAVRWKMIVVLLLSIIMANGYYSFAVLSSVFPFLNRFTKSGLFGLGASVLLISAVCGGIYNTICAYKRNQMRADSSPLAGVCSQDVAATCECGKRQNPSGTCQGEPRRERTEESSPGQPADAVQKPGRDAVIHLRHMIGIGAAVMGIFASAVIIFYALCRNQEFLWQLTNQKLPYLTFNLLIGFAIVLAALFVVTILMFYFIQMCYTIIMEMFQKRRLDIQNDSLLMCVSVFVTMFSFSLCRNSTMQDLFNLVNGSNEVASLLVMILSFTTLTFVTLIIYKVLRSFARPDGTLRAYTNKIFGLVIRTVGEMIIKILEIAANAPGFLDLLLDAVRKGMEVLGAILFDMVDEEDDMENIQDVLHRLKESS